MQKDVHVLHHRSGVILLRLFEAEQFANVRIHAVAGNEVAAIYAFFAAVTVPQSRFNADVTVRNVSTFHPPFRLAREVLGHVLAQELLGLALSVYEQI